MPGGDAGRFVKPAVSKVDSLAADTLEGEFPMLAAGRDICVEEMNLGGKCETATRLESTEKVCVARLLSCTMSFLQSVTVPLGASIDSKTGESYCSRVDVLHSYHAERRGRDNCNSARVARRRSVLEKVKCHSRKLKHNERSFGCTIKWRNKVDATRYCLLQKNALVKIFL